MKKLLLCACLLLNHLPAPASPAAETPSAQDHAQIRETVAAFVQQQTAALPGKVTIGIDEIDQRIRLPACTRLEPFLPAGSQLVGKASVGVRCAEKNGWSIFVPVHVRISLTLLVSTRQLPLGHALQKEDITGQTVEASRAGGFTDPGQVLGKVLRHGIAAGQVLREDMLRPPYSVTQGQVVQLVVQGSGFSVRNEGVALNNASEGQAVQVRTGSGRVISGIARAGGVVEIKR